MFSHWRTPVASLILAALTLASQAKADDRPYIMGALGDSITMGFNAGGPLDHPANSWSVGWSRNVNSHYERLQDIFGDVAEINAARSGAKAAEIDTQINKMLAKGKPDYVTILMGANDVCSWPKDHASSLATYESNMTKGVEKLIAANPNVKIVLAPVPNLMNLWEVGRVNNCQGKWNLFKICGPILGEGRTDQERAEFMDRVGDLNSSLEKITMDHSDNVKFAATLATAEFERKHISGLDCFHPGMQGQALLADKTWEDGWFPSEDK